MCIASSPLLYIYIYMCRRIWEAVLDEMMLLNGKILKKKSTNVRSSSSIVPNTF